MRLSVSKAVGEDCKTIIFIRLWEELESPTRIVTCCN